MQDICQSGCLSQALCVRQKESPEDRSILQSCEDLMTLQMSIKKLFERYCDESSQDLSLLGRTYADNGSNH